LTRDLALTSRTDFAIFASISTGSTVSAVGLDIDAVSATIGQAALA
jgi:hypothetical protein